MLSKMGFVVKIFVVYILGYQLLSNRGVTGTQDCRAKLDLVIVLDSSLSVGSTNFKKVTAFIESLIGSLPVQPDGIRVSVVRYSSNAQVISYLDQHMNKSDKMATVHEMEFRAGTTQTHLALKLTRTAVLNPKRGDRPDVPDLIILTTDGVSNKQALTQLEATTLKEKSDLKIFVIGIGKAVADEELVNVASRPEMVYKLTDFSQLTLIVGTLARFSCSDMKESSISDLKSWSASDSESISSEDIESPISKTLSSSQSSPTTTLAPPSTTVLLPALSRSPLPASTTMRSLSALWTLGHRSSVSSPPRSTLELVPKTTTFSSTSAEKSSITESHSVTLLLETRKLLSHADEDFVSSSVTMKKQDDRKETTKEQTKQTGLLRPRSEVIPINDTYTSFEETIFSLSKGYNTKATGASFGSSIQTRTVTSFSKYLSLPQKKGKDQTTRPKITGSHLRSVSISTATDSLTSDTSIPIITPSNTINIATSTPPNTINIATSTASNTFNIATSTPPNTINIATSTPPNTVNIDTSTPPNTINIATSTPPNTINIATSTPPNTVNIATSTPPNTVNIATSTAPNKVNVTIPAPHRSVNVTIPTPNKVNITTSTPPKNVNVTSSSLPNKVNEIIPNSPTTINVVNSTPSYKMNVITSPPSSKAAVETSTPSSKTNMIASTQSSNFNEITFTPSSETTETTSTLPNKINVIISTPSSITNTKTSTPSGKNNMITSTSNVVISTSSSKINMINSTLPQINIVTNSTIKPTSITNGVSNSPESVVTNTSSSNIHGQTSTVSNQTSAVLYSTPSSNQTSDVHNLTFTLDGQVSTVKRDTSSYLSQTTTLDIRTVRTLGDKKQTPRKGNIRSSSESFLGNRGTSVARLTNPRETSLTSSSYLNTMIVDYTILPVDSATETDIRVNMTMEDNKYILGEHGGEISSRDIYIFIAGGSAAAVILTSLSTFVAVLCRRRKTNRMRPDKA